MTPANGRTVFRLLTVLAALLAATPSVALPVLHVQAGQGLEVPIAVVPCATGASGPHVLIAQRVLVQRSAVGGSPGVTIPSWAGQWGSIVGSPPGAGQSLQQVAARLFYAQTGTALPDPSAALVLSDASDTDVTRIVIAPMSETALAALEQSAAQAIATTAAQAGVLSAVADVSIAEAVERLGPVSPPLSGWGAYILRSVYGGAPPGALDTVFPLLVNQISVRTKSTPEIFQTALLLAAQHCADPPAQR